MLPVIDPPNIGRHAKGLPVITELDMPVPFTQRIQIPKAELAKLNALAGKQGLTLTNYVMAAMGDAICASANCAETYLTAYQGRVDSRLNNYVGLHSHMLVIRYAANADRPLAQSAQIVADRMKDCLAHLPSSALTGDNPIPRAVAERGAKLKQYMVHIPRATGRARGSAFNEGFFAKKGFVQKVGPYSLEAIDLEPSAGTDGELQVDIVEDSSGFGLLMSADSEAYTPKELKIFTKTFLSALRKE